MEEEDVERKYEPEIRDLLWGAVLCHDATVVVMSSQQLTLPEKD